MSGLGSINRIKIINFHSIIFILLLFTMIPFKTPQFNIGINVNIADFIILLMLILAVSIKPASFVRGIYYKFLGIYLVLLCYYIIIIIYSYSLDFDYHQILGRFRNLYVYPLVFFYGLLIIKRKEDFEQIFNIICVFFVLAMMVGMINIIKPLPMLSREGTDYYLMIVNQRICLISILIFLSAFFSLCYGRKKIVSIFYIVLCSIAAMGSQNRSILICYALASIMLAFVLFRNKNVKVILSSTLAVLLFIGSFIICFSWFIKTNYYNYFESRYNKIYSTITFNSHFENSQGMIRIGRSIATFKRTIDQYPVIGSGWGGQGSEYDIYDFKGNYLRTAVGTPHNYYLAVFEQTGFIGFIILMYLFYNIFKLIKPKRSLKLNTIMEHSLFLFFIIVMIFNVANVYMYGLASYIAFCYFFFGLAVANSRMKVRVA